jgi:hypothetical protein
MIRKIFKNIILLGIAVIISVSVFAEGNWPREIDLDNGAKIILYQPQNESLQGNKLTSRTVVSVKKSESADPIFGVVWTEAILNTDKDTRMATLESIKVTDVKFPDVTDETRINDLKSLLEKEIPTWNIEFSIDELIATLEQEQTATTDKFSTDAPKIIYRNKPSTLILIDGDPIIKKDDNLKMDKVVNTPYLIVKNPDDKKFYLYTGKYWYASAAVESGWTLVTTLPQKIKSLDAEIKKQEKESQATDDQKTTEPKGPTEIVISKVPAELLQSDGDATFASVEGTELLYVSNSDDYIFKVINDQLYYVLLSGRWYKAAKLEGPWTYVPSDKLPSDFAKIPEGSPVDAVLANVAGTDAAREAVQDAQIPQTAKVDRKTATCKVTYDGDPKFEKVEGTDIYIAVNASITVMKQSGKYYAVENGVWFISDSPHGPWKASDKRPEDIDKVPPSSEVYNTKYVYIYDVTPEYIYMGYTPGYVNCYVYGPTVIYGTGFYYAPWYGTVYYPRPVTYGFGVHYNPWYGWSMNFTVSYGFFSFSVGGYPGGWWGPPVYRPPYYPPHYHGGYYGHHPPPPPPPRGGYNYHGGGDNIYRNRNDVATRDLNRQPTASTRDRQPSSATKPSTTNPSSTRPSGATRDVTPQQKTRDVSNNVYSDKSGNVYKKDQSGDWQQRSNGNWQSTSRTSPSTQQMDRSAQMRDRSDMRVNQSTPSRSTPSTGGGGGRSMGGGGGMRGGRR